MGARACSFTNGTMCRGGGGEWGLMLGGGGGGGGGSIFRNRPSQQGFFSPKVLAKY